MTVVLYNVPECDIHPLPLGIRHCSSWKLKVVVAGGERRSVTFVILPVLSANVQSDLLHLYRECDGVGVPQSGLKLLRNHHVEATIVGEDTWRPEQLLTLPHASTLIRAMSEVSGAVYSSLPPEVRGSRYRGWRNRYRTCRDAFSVLLRQLAADPSSAVSDRPGNPERIRVSGMFQKFIVWRRESVALNVVFVFCFASLFLGLSYLGSIITSPTGAGSPV